MRGDARMRFGIGVLLEIVSHVGEKKSLNMALFVSVENDSIY